MPSYMDCSLCFSHVSFAVHCSEYYLLTCRESPPTGKILWVSLPCLSSTRQSVLLRKTMQETLQLLSWLVLLPKPRYQRWILVCATYLLETVSCWLNLSLSLRCSSLVEPQFEVICT